MLIILSCNFNNCELTTKYSIHKYCRDTNSAFHCHHHHHHHHYDNHHYQHHHHHDNDNYNDDQGHLDLNSVLSAGSGRSKVTVKEDRGITLMVYLDEDDDEDCPEYIFFLFFDITPSLGNGDCKSHEKIWHVAWSMHHSMCHIIKSSAMVERK